MSKNASPIMVRCTLEEKEMYKKIANEKGLNLSSYIRFLLMNEIKKNEKKINCDN